MSVGKLDAVYSCVKVASLVEINRLYAGKIIAYFSADGYISVCPVGFISLCGYNLRSCYVNIYIDIFVFIIFNLISS